MATCEMCGEQGTLRRTKVEGATLELCEDCQEVGEVMDAPSTPTNPRSQRSGTSGNKRSARSRSARHQEPDTDLVEDFDRRVKQARESRGWSVGELAGKLKEKDSVVRRVEAGKLSPDQTLARKLENALGITLYEEVSDVSPQRETDTPSGTTIGDVAEVRERD